MIYEVGGKIIATRHGTDHSYDEWYRVVAIKSDRLMLEKWSSGEGGLFVHFSDIRKDVKYEPPKPQVKLDEDLFTL